MNGKSNSSYNNFDITEGVGLAHNPANHVEEEDNLYKIFCKRIYDVVKKFVSEREMSAQEAALDATSLPLIEFSRQFVPIQLNNTQEMRLMLKPESRMKDEKDFFYSLPVTKYIHRM